jgi:hypothetical protein
VTKNPKKLTLTTQRTIQKSPQFFGNTLIPQARIFGENKYKKQENLKNIDQEQEKVK